MSTITVKEWTDALKSGKYEQGRGCLRSLDDKFCCLGVACDLLGVKWKKETVKHYYRTGHTSIWAGDMPSDDIKFPGELDLDELAQMNDDGDTFDQIVDVILERSDPNDIITYRKADNANNVTTV